MWNGNGHLSWKGMQPTLLYKLEWRMQSLISDGSFSSPLSADTMGKIGLGATVALLLVHSFHVFCSVTAQAPSTPGSVPVEPILARSAFPAGFTFGASTSALQVEGATHEGGRGPSVWDTFAKLPGKISDNSTPDVACDSYHKYKEDVRLVKQANMDAYRFSISWPRVLPKGRLSGGVNMEGIKYYDNLINELLANGIKPFVTLFHWDLPQALENEYGGFRDRRIVKDFADFSDLCFLKFGDRVKHWITENEPYMYSTVGYDSGVGAPGRCSTSPSCPAGNSATEPYIVAHNLILAHAVAVKLYKEKYAVVQKGQIGITFNVNWVKPFSQSKPDVDANERAIDFNFGWFMDPLVYGDYPFIMRALVGKRLPTFSAEESRLVKGSYDFIGLNYYFSQYASGIPFLLNNSGVSYTDDIFVNFLVKKGGIAIGETTRCQGFFSYPKGMLDMLIYTKKKYKNPSIYITENGVCDDDNQLSFKDAMNDKARINYYTLHMGKLKEAINLGANVKGYFAWSLLDNWEWISGYSKRFGITYVDFHHGQKRYKKDSFKWFSRILKS